MLFERTTFFNTIRPHMPKGVLTPQQVAGLSAKLDVWEEHYSDQDYRYLAVCLANNRWESNHTMSPVREAYNVKPEAKRKAYLMDLYDVTGSNPARARDNGNTEPGDGYIYCGNGDIQTTWKNNYKKLGDRIGVNLVKYPSKMLDPMISARVMFEGMLFGLFTGRKVSDYFIGKTVPDVFGSRACVNGDKSKIPKGGTVAIGSIIVDYYGHFLKALEAAMAAMAHYVPPAIIASTATAPIDPLPTTGAKAMTSQFNIGSLLANVAANAVAQLGKDQSFAQLPAEAARPVAEAVAAVVKSDPVLQQVAAQVNEAATPVPWYKSSVLQGVAITLVSQLINAKFGIVLGPEWQPLIELLFGTLGTGIGLAVTTLGRVLSRAQPVTLTASK